MVYFIFILLVLVLFLVVRNDKRASDQYLIAILLSFVAVILCAFFYISKDPYYYNVLNYYFALPKEVWNTFMYSPIPQRLSLRGLNVASVAFIYFCINFSLSYLSDMKLRRSRPVTVAIRVWLVFELLVNDPWIGKTVYMALCDTIIPVELLESVIRFITSMNRLLHIGLLVLATVHVFERHFKSATVFFRVYSLGECISFAAVVITYLMVFWFAPSNLIHVSKLANLVTYQPMPFVNVGTLFFRLVPYYLLLAGASVFYFILQYMKVQRKLAGNELEITRQIDAANTTSKAFCHYMKNELLAIKAEIEMMDVAETSEEEKSGILDRCDNLYERLNEIHRSTRESALTLKITELPQLMDTILAHLSPDFNGITLRKEYESDLPPVLCDGASFEQAVHNILVNSIAAVKQDTKDEKTIAVGIGYIDSWVHLTIRDNGVGIPEANLSKIFTPFYSSQPIREHWGVGLALTYKIIKAHGGRIEVESHVHEGTVMRILLPALSR